MVSPLMEGSFTFGGTRFALGAAMQIPSLAAAELERTGHVHARNGSPKPSALRLANT